MNRMKLIYLFGCLWIGFCMSMVMAQSSPNYRLTAIGVTEGSSFSSSSNYKAIPIIGQPVIGTSSSTQYRVQFGLMPIFLKSYGIINPFIADTSQQFDLSWLLPNGGMFGSGTTGWQTFTSGSASVTPITGTSVRLFYRNSSGFFYGNSTGLAGIGTNPPDTCGLSVSRYLDLSAGSITSDQILAGALFKPVDTTFPGTVRLEVYGDNTNHPFGVEMSLSPETSSNCGLSMANFMGMGLILTPVALESNYLRRVSITGQGGSTNTNEAIDVKQMVLGSVRFTQ
jgi:hypothetical protein